MTLLLLLQGGGPQAPAADLSGAYKNAAHVKFRDKRAVVKFRDKRAVVKFRDKRALGGGKDDGN